MYRPGAFHLFAGTCCIFLVLFFSPTTSEPLSFDLPGRSLDNVARLQLPTQNDALFQQASEQFFQHVNRYRRGQVSRPWEAGRYGFVRNPREVGGSTIYTRFHEGIDIKPIHRGQWDEPLDTVRTISDGTVVYTNSVAGQSNYGKYVVVEHRWGESPFYSLYAHLSEVFVRSGEVVGIGDRLGRMGYTGAGINRGRAHVHLEVAMLMNRRFQPWYDTYYDSEPNYHDIFSGLNLKGMDVAALFLAKRENPSLTVREFVLGQEPAYSLTVPNDGRLDLLERYPWLWQGTGAVDPDDAAAFTITFTQTGLPVRVKPSPRSVNAPELADVEQYVVAQRCVSNGVLRRRRGQCRVSRVGERFVDLLIARVD